MSDIAMKMAEMVNMLPPSEQTLAYEMVKRMVRAWDPDFTKLTASEAQELEEAEKDDAPMTLDDYMKSRGMKSSS